MLVKFEGEKEKFYLCTCSDWDAIVLAKSPSEAASTAIKGMIDEVGNEFNVSATMCVKKINQELENTDILFRMDKILADIGMYKESRALKEIFEK
jgi:hypothetical protein